MPPQFFSSSMSTPQQQRKLDFSYLNVDFNNIHDSRQLQRIIIQLQAIIQNKITQINQLTLVNDRETQQREIIIRKMTQKNSNNSKKIEQYSQQIYSVSEQYSRFNRQAQEEKDRQKRAIESTHLAEMAELNKRIQELEIEYKKVKQQEELQAEYVSRIQSMKKEIITMQYQHNDGMNKLQAVEIKQNQQLQLLLKQQLTTTHKTAPSHAMNKLTTQLRTNEQQNIILKQKLSTLQSQLQKLKKQRNQIVTKRKQLKINVTLNEDELQQYKAVGSLQKAKIKAYKDKIQAMKILISDQVARKEKIVTQRKKQRQSNMKVLKLRLFNLQKEKQQLKMKIQKMNLLAETILQQRSEIEEFFVMALDSCKKEIEQFEKGRGGNGSGNGMGEQQKSYGEKVDIDELLPKDKQRILTNLYTKLAFGSK